MKSENINLLLICIAYFIIGLILTGNYIHDKTLSLTQDSIRRLIMIEMITKEQFDILEKKVRNLENQNNRISYYE